MRDMPGRMPDRNEVDMKRDWVAWLVLAMAWFSTIGAYGLFDPDEGRYAEIPRAMFVSGDWVTPTLNGLPYFEKPPLQYWATATLYAVFGVSEVASRLWAFALAFGCLPLTLWLAGALGLGRSTAWRAAVLLAISPFFIIVGHINLLDQAFTFFLLGAVTAFVVAQQIDVERRARWLIVAWCALAAAVLSKGIVAFVLTGGTLVCYAIVQRDLGSFKRVWQPAGVLVFALLTVPWFVLVEQRNPGFSQFFFVHEHFARFLTTVHRREGPVWYFVPIVLLAIAPVFVLWRRSIARAWSDRDAGQSFAAFRFLVIFCMWVFVFFSISQSKLPPYMLPLIPPLMVLFARSIEDDEHESGRVLRIQTILVSVGVVAMLWFDRERDGVVDWPVYAACGVSLVALGVAWMVRDRRGARSVLAHWLPVAAASLIAWQGLLVAYAVLPPSRSSDALSVDVGHEIRPSTRIYFVKQYRHSLSFYLARSMVLVDYRGEMDEGLRRVGDTDPKRFIGDLKAFVARWRAESDAVAFVDPEYVDDLQALGFVGRRLASRDTRSIAFARR
jgi:4-amino-4-deoxy-L-arabinose transferase-like glycosyltransferase